MQAPIGRRLLLAVALSVVAVQIIGAGTSYKAIQQQLKEKRGDRKKGTAPGVAVPARPAKRPTPEVTLVKPKGVNPGQTVDITITGKNFTPDAVVYFEDPFVDHIKQTVVSPQEVAIRIALAPDAWPGRVQGRLESPENGAAASFPAFAVAGKVGLELQVEDGMRIRLTPTGASTDGRQQFTAEIFKLGAKEPDFKGQASLERRGEYADGSIEVGASGAMGMASVMEGISGKAMEQKPGESMEAYAARMQKFNEEMQTKMQKYQAPCESFRIDPDSFASGKEVAGSLLCQGEPRTRRFKVQVQRLS